MTQVKILQIRTPRLAKAPQKELSAKMLSGLDLIIG